MTIPTTCPHCGAPYAKDGKFSCGAEWISGKAFQSQFCKLNAAAKEVLDNPFPFDFDESKKEDHFSDKYCNTMTAAHNHNKAVRKMKGATL